MRKVKFRAMNEIGNWVYFSAWGLNPFLDKRKFKHLVQYTGLKDKKGEEGYHKDIWTDGLNKYLVEWNDKGAKFQLEGITIPRVYSMAHFPEGEIIGNSFENPEFLEKE